MLLSSRACAFILQAKLTSQNPVFEITGHHASALNQATPDLFQRPVPLRHHQMSQLPPLQIPNEAVRNAILESSRQASLPQLPPELLKEDSLFRTQNSAAGNAALDSNRSSVIPPYPSALLQENRPLNGAVHPDMAARLNKSFPTINPQRGLGSRERLLEGKPLDLEATRPGSLDHLLQGNPLPSRPIETLSDHQTGMNGTSGVLPSLGGGFRPVGLTNLPPTLRPGDLQSAGGNTFPSGNAPVPDPPGFKPLPPVGKILSFPFPFLPPRLTFCSHPAVSMPLHTMSIRWWSGKVFLITHTILCSKFALTVSMVGFKSVK